MLLRFLKCNPNRPRVKLVLHSMLRRKLQSDTTFLDSSLSKKLKHISSEGSNELQDNSIPNRILGFETELNQSLSGLDFPKPVEYIYNPVKYAFEAHSLYVKKYCLSTKKILFIGMNPGPHGMCQTGVPFGEVTAIREWLEIDCEVGKPDRECPKRPVNGFNHNISEVSGKRLWGAFKDICKTPENLFKSAYVHNYCPLAFMKKEGVNVTPSEIKGPSVKKLEELCDQTLFEILKLLKIEIVIGIGVYARDRAKIVLNKYREELGNIEVFYMPHPSPRAPNNTNWPEKAIKMLEECGLIKYFKPDN